MTVRLVLALIGLTFSGEAPASEALRVATWNIANLHHEIGVALRSWGEPRDEQDFTRLREFARSLDVHVFALQEIGSPLAAARVFPQEQYHLFISDRYKEGDEKRTADERDIYTAFAVRKDKFKNAPTVSSIMEFSIANIEIDRNGIPVNRRTRAALLLQLKLGDRVVQLLNVHLKSSCHGNSLQPIFDERRDGRAKGNRFDCRTLAAQGLLLENWIEQQKHIGNGVIVLGDLNRRLNILDNNANRKEHFWRDLNDGAPDELTLRKGPLGVNDNCWVNNPSLFHKEHIDFVIFDTSLDSMIRVDTIRKVGLPFESDQKYSGRNGQKLSDHCPVIFEITYPQ